MRHLYMFTSFRGPSFNSRKIRNWDKHNKEHYMYEFILPVKILKNQTPEKFVVIILKFEQHSFNMEKGFQSMQTE